MVPSSKQSEDRATPANFMNVTQMRGYVPSWLAPKGSDPSGLVAPSSSHMPRSIAGPGVMGDAATEHVHQADSQFGEQRVSILEVDDAEPAFPTPDLDAIQQEYRALEEAKQETMRLNTEFARAISKIQKSRQQMLDEASRQVVELALLAAGRVIVREARLEPRILEDLVREALRVLVEREPTKVRVGRGFESAISAASASLALEATRVEFCLDPELEEFGCIVQTDIANVDESLNSRFDALVAALGTGTSE